MRHQIILVNHTASISKIEDGLMTSLLSKPWLQYGSQPAQGLYLQWDKTGLSLNKAGQKGKVQVDFVTGSARHRRMFGGGELLAKAVQAKTQPRIWDATGGLGRDAFIMASLGLTVMVFERHPVVHALLADGIRRAQTDEHISTIIARIQLIHGSISDMVSTDVSALPEVIYLDPMYPHRQKTAAVKKEMAYFHELVGVSQPEEEQLLLDHARRWAQKRVVVKRPYNGAFLANCIPAFQYLGKTTRFDVYLPLSMA